MDWNTYKQMKELAKAQEYIPTNDIDRKLQQYKIDEISERYTNKRPFKTKNIFKGYLGAALALPTLYSILNNPAYSMQQKAENIIGEGMNYVPILGDLISPTATDEEARRNYEEWIKQGRPNYQRGN